MESQSADYYGDGDDVDDGDGDDYDTGDDDCKNGKGAMQRHLGPGVVALLKSRCLAVAR